MREFITIRDSNCLIRRKCKKGSFYNRFSDEMNRVRPAHHHSQSRFSTRHTSTIGLYFFIYWHQHHVQRFQRAITRVTRFRVVPVSSNYSELTTNPWKRSKQKRTIHVLSPLFENFVPFPPRETVCWRNRERVQRSLFTNTTIVQAGYCLIISKRTS